MLLQAGGAISEASRAALAFTVPTATAIALRKELADVWLKAGAVGQALEELEALQEWEALVTCYIMAGAEQYFDSECTSEVGAIAAVR